MAETTPEIVLGDIVRHLRRLGRPFALVGGLAVSLRAEARFTRDVDLAIVAADDAEVERLVYDQDLLVKLEALLASVASG